MKIMTTDQIGNKVIDTPKRVHTIYLLHLTSPDGYREFSNYVSQQRHNPQVEIDTKILSPSQIKSLGWFRKYGFTEYDLLSKSYIIDGERVIEIYKTGVKT